MMDRTRNFAAMPDQAVHDPYARDCANCVALCCVLPGFDKSDKFAISREKGEVCPNLGPDNRCAIHESLDEEGFSGCVEYTCFGAGQRVTARHAPRDWRADPELIPEMFGLLALLRIVHELISIMRDEKDLGPEDELPPAARILEAVVRDLDGLPSIEDEDAAERFLGGFLAKLSTQKS